MWITEGYSCVLSYLEIGKAFRYNATRLQTVGCAQSRVYRLHGTILVVRIASAAFAAIKESGSIRGTLADSHLATILL
jgi:hypothetical protein